MTGSAAPPGGADTSSAPILQPRDAATLVIVDRVKGVPRVLMGRRRMDVVFMPGKYVFPGGRVDDSDHKVESADELRPLEVAKLLIDMKEQPGPERARALALAAVRETFEEAGLVIGAATQTPTTVEAPGWSEFFGCGFRPRIGPLTLFARAITPPGRPRRYDTRFFCISADEISHEVETSDGELSGLHWLTIEEARSLDIPAITRIILEDLTDFLKAAGTDSSHAPIPYYHFKDGSFCRELLAVDEASLQLDSALHPGMVRANSNEHAPKR